MEIVRTLVDGFKHRQHERAFEFYDPEIEWDGSGQAEAIPDIAGVYRGHEGVRACWPTSTAGRWRIFSDQQSALEAAGLSE